MFLPFKRPLKPIRISGKIKSTKSETSGLREPRSRCIHSRSSSDSRSKDWCLTLYLAPWFRLSVEFGVCNLFSYFFPCSLMKPDKTIPWIVKKPPPVRWVVFFLPAIHGDSVLLRLVLDTTPPDVFCLSFDEMSVIVQDKVETMESWNHFQQHHEKHCRKITIKSCDKKRQSLYLLQSTWLHGDLEICWNIIQSTIPKSSLHWIRFWRFDLCPRSRLFSLELLPELIPQMKHLTIHFISIGFVFLSQFKSHPNMNTFNLIHIKTFICETDFSCAVVDASLKCYWVDFPKEWDIGGFQK